MPKSSFVDFKAIKAAVTMERVLEHYGLLNGFKRGNDSLSGPCPIHKGSNPTQFRVSISKNVWNCFSECKHGGNVLDFIAKMENATVHAAALKAVEWFNLDREAVSAQPDGDQEPSCGREDRPAAAASKPTAKRSTPNLEPLTPNKPLQFRLDKLDREHPYLKERGLTLETVVDFGAGFCSKGVMANHIAIPIHTREGAVVAYAGRFPGEPTGDVLKYRFPKGFHKSLELFNVDRASKEPTDQSLVIVEGFFDCMRIHQHGHRRVVALMGSSMSAAQENLIRDITDTQSQIIVMLDEDEAGQAAREEIAGRLAKFAFVRIHSFPKEGMQPAELSAEELSEILA